MIEKRQKSPTKNEEGKAFKPTKINKVKSEDNKAKQSEFNSVEESIQRTQLKSGSNTRQPGFKKAEKLFSKYPHLK